MKVTKIITNDETQIFAEPKGQTGTYYISPQAAKDSDVVGEYGHIRFQTDSEKGCKSRDVVAVLVNWLNQRSTDRPVQKAIDHLDEALHWLNHSRNDQMNAQTADRSGKQLNPKA